MAIFVILAAGTIAGALMTITRRNPVTAVMSLVATFFALAGIYATLNAHFVAILQILVYAGAIMVLFIFVVMILNRDEITPVSFKGIFTRVVGLLSVAYIIGFLAVPVVWRERASLLLRGRTDEPPPGFGTVAGVGMSLFHDTILPFEAISLLLLIAIVGGVIVSRSSHVNEMAEERARHDHEIRGKASDEIKLLSRGGKLEPAGDDEHAAATAGHH